MNDKKHTIEIPEIYLVHIAACGNMGNGKLMNTMKIWAEKECNKIGLNNKVKEAQEDNLRQLKGRIKNILSDDEIFKIDAVLNNSISDYNTPTILTKINIKKLHESDRLLRKIVESNK